MKLNIDTNISRIISKIKVMIKLKLGYFNLVSRPEHYQYLHDEFDPYIINNWLLDDIDFLAKRVQGNICEVGCGNGKFILSASKYFKTITGIDWAKSSGIEKLPKNCKFIKHDLSKGMPKGSFDMICSADFLEHLRKKDVLNLIGEMCNSSPLNYHKIACYDDGGSHLTILSPEEWLDIFKKFSPDFKIRDITDRRNNNQEVVIISNF
mgnify:CR=1 FL=1|tara:strand:+ start:103 stop:726 length:624 start_codon:yes stop_codon:yes gene_type:complete